MSSSIQIPKAQVEAPCMLCASRQHKALPFFSIALAFSIMWSGFAQIVVPRDAIPSGTEVEIELLESISSETLQAGQAVPFKLVQALESNGATLLAAGTTLTGSVTSAHAAGHWGKAGAFDLKLNPLQLPDATLLHLDFHRPARLNERGERTGETIESAIAMTYYFPLIPVALIAGAKKGKPFAIRAGERYLVYVTGTERVATELAKP